MYSFIEFKGTELNNQHQMRYSQGHICEEGLEKYFTRQLPLLAH